MNCQSHYPDLIEAARSGAPPPLAAQSHLESCAACRGFFEVQIALQGALPQSLAEDPHIPFEQNYFSCDPPPNLGGDLEWRLLAEFDSNARALRPKLGWRWAATAGLAASLAIGVALVRQPQPPPMERPFLEIPYIPPLAPYERTRIERMEVPVAALIAAGFAVHTPDAGASLEADILFGQDGRAHAVRLVSNSDSNRRTN